MVYLILGMTCIALIIIWFLEIKQHLKKLDEHAEDAYLEMKIMWDERRGATAALLSHTEKYDIPEKEEMWFVKQFADRCTRTSDHEFCIGSEYAFVLSVRKLIRDLDAYTFILEDPSYRNVKEAFNRTDEECVKCAEAYNRCAEELNEELNRFPGSFVSESLHLHPRSQYDLESEQELTCRRAF